MASYDKAVGHANSHAEVLGVSIWYSAKPIKLLLQIVCLGPRRRAKPAHSEGHITSGYPKDMCSIFY